VDSLIKLWLACRLHSRVMVWGHSELGPITGNHGHVTKTCSRRTFGFSELLFTGAKRK